jgi:glycosyltransferase involved in cell wall biosynthesis
MILQTDFPPDIRIEKELSSLCGHYQVYLLANNKNQNERVEKSENLTILRLPKFSALPQKAAIALRMPLFFNPLWLLLIFNAVKKYKIDYIHVHDLPLAQSALWIGRIKKKPVVYDMHENYPAVMKLWLKDSKLNWILKNPFLAAILDRHCLKKATKLIAVVEERKTDLVNSGIASQKIHVVSNTIQLTRFQAFDLDQTIINKYLANLTLVYIGFLGSDRGLDTAISGVSLLLDKLPSIKMVLVGDGKEKEKLKSLVNKKNIKEYVEFIPWIDFSIVPSYIAAASICIDPRPASLANDTTISHKIFQYMAMGKPLLVSDTRPFARIVSESNCGEIFKSNSAESFAEGILRIRGSKTSYGENGIKAIQEKYNWDQSGKVLLTLYDELKMR